jgi:hypothetical protein
MTDDALEKLRQAKAEMIERLAGRADFAGVGIGRHDGRLVLKVNWRALPPPADRPDKIGDVEVTHHAVGNIRAQSQE